VRAASAVQETQLELHRFWQVTPPKPSTQVHVKPLRASEQVPPFWHGLLPQYGTLEAHVGPKYVDVHEHVKELRPLVQEPPFRQGDDAQLLMTV